LACRYYLVVSKGFSVADIFVINSRTATDRVYTVLNSINSSDYLKINSQIEVFSVGFRFDQKTYISFGFYEELDAIGYAPKDIPSLLNEGNAASLNRTFSVSQVLFKLDVLGAVHAGITKNLNDQLTLGGRFKVYSSSLNLETANNYGTFTTNLGSNNIYI
jgi:hypothetical protein